MNKDGTAKLGDMNVSKVAKKGLLYTQTGTPYYARYGDLYELNKLLLLLKYKNDSFICYLLFSPEVWKD